MNGETDVAWACVATVGFSCGDICGSVSRVAGTILTGQPEVLGKRLLHFTFLHLPIL